MPGTGGDDVPVGRSPSGENAIFVRIKLLHTAVWLFFAVCIVAIPIAGAGAHYRWSAALIGLVLVECLPGQRCLGSICELLNKPLMAPSTWLIRRILSDQCKQR